MTKQYLKLKMTKTVQNTSGMMPFHSKTKQVKTKQYMFRDMFVYGNLERKSSNQMQNIFQLWEQSSYRIIILY